MAEESLTDKFWKLASYSAYDLLGFGSAAKDNGDTEDVKEHIKEDKKTSKSKWPSFVKSSNKLSWGEYDEPNASQFDIRNKHYLKDGIKIKSKQSLFQLADLEMYKIDTVSKSYHIVKHNKSWYKKFYKKLPNDTFYFIYNLQLESLNISIVATFLLQTETESDTDIQSQNILINDQNLIDEMLNDLSDSSDDNIDDTKENVKEEEKKEEEKTNKKLEITVQDIENMPNIKQIVHNIENIKNNESNKNLWRPKIQWKPYDNTNVWNRFLNGDELFINQRLKIIPRIVEGNYLFMNSMVLKPALIGMKTPQRCYRGSNYLEIDCEVDNSMIIAQLAKTANYISTYLVVDVMFTIEGQTKDELPERIIGGFQIIRADSTKAIKLD